MTVPPTRTRAGCCTGSTLRTPGFGVNTESLASRRDNRTDDVTVSGRPGTAIDWQSRASIPGIYRLGELPGGCTECVAELTIGSRHGHAAVESRAKALELVSSIRLVDDHQDPARWRAR